jgi:uroporphyrinogen decarboxylase
MHTVERYQCAIHGDTPDRVPVAPSVLTRAIRRAGIRQYDFHTNPEVLAQAAIDHCEAFDFDGLYISSDNVIIYEALGGHIIFPDADSYPFWTTPLLTDAAGLAALSVPDPKTSGRMPVVIEASRLAAQQVGDRRFIISNIDSGPFQLASTLMGMDRAMTLLIDSPDEMKDILAFCRDVAIAYGLAMAGSGCHGIQFGESTAGLLGRALYEEVVWPFDCQLIEALKLSGVAVVLHVCGDSTRIFDLMVASGADCLEIDTQVDLAWAKARAAGKVALKGNVNTGSFLGPVDEFQAECRQTLLAGKPGGGFILSSGCETPADTPDAVLQAMRAVVDTDGYYS